MRPAPWGTRAALIVAGWVRLLADGDPRAWTVAVAAAAAFAWWAS